MHEHCEIILPPEVAREEVEKAVHSILAPFNENFEDPCPYETAAHRKYAFFDWYTIGGRYAGEKELEAFDKEKLKDFEELLISKKITVSSVRAGKPTLSPDTQIKKVDRLWREAFPDSGFDSCPLFSHAIDQYNDHSSGDICLVSQANNCECSRVIVGGKDYKEGLSAVFMVSKEQWNGTNFLRSNWDGRLNSAIEMYNERIYKFDTKPPITDDWITVTVDCHS